MAGRAVATPVLGQVVAAVQGIVLTVAASGVVDRRTGMIAVAAALLLLAESFGRNVIWLYRTGAGPRTRRALRIAITVLSVVILWGVLVAPDRDSRLTPAAFVRIPVEGLALVAVAVVLPASPRRIVAAVAGILFALLALVNILNIAFNAEIGQPFNVVLDWGEISPAIGVVRDSIGATLTNIVLVALWLGLILFIGAIIASAIHITTVAARHRRAAFRALAALTAVWALCAGLSLQLVPGSPVASASAAGLVVTQVRKHQDSVPRPASAAGCLTSANAQHARDHAVSGRSSTAPTLKPASPLLTCSADCAARMSSSPSSKATARPPSRARASPPASTPSCARAPPPWPAQAGPRRAPGSTPPGFGGISQLGHSTLLSGLWVNTTQRYGELVASSRFTLSGAFNRPAGAPSATAPVTTTTSGPGMSFYRFDKIYDRRDVGYHGPTFSYSPMPDQYTLAAFQRLELTPGHKPVMAEIDLTSSHTPWAPLPVMVPWDKVGNGSIFDPMPARGETRSPSRAAPARSARPSPRRCSTRCRP